MASKDGQPTSAARRSTPSAKAPWRAQADHAGVEAIFQHLDPTRSGTIQKEELLSILSVLGISDAELALLQTTEMFQDQQVPYSQFLRWIFAPASNSDSGQQADVSSQDVETELNISEPNGLGSKAEAEADETEIENGGDILQAAKEGNVGAVRRLLQVAPQSLERVDEVGEGPLALAARNGHVEVVQVLLGAGASVEAKNNNGDGPLALAALTAHLEVVEALVAAGAPLEAKNDEGDGPLHAAIEKGHVGVVEALLAAGASIDAKNFSGSGLLAFAAVKGYLEVVEALLAAGASIDEAQDQFGWKTLHYAADRGHTAIVERLLAAGATVDAANDAGKTPLHYAACNGHTAIVERLIAAGAAVDAADNDGSTPLHRAAVFGHAAVAEQLIAAGAAVDAADNDGRTPYDFAKKRGHREVMGVLDPVFVALLSGRSCKCNSSIETVQELKEEAEKRLEIKIQRLIGVNMEPLNEAKTLEEAGVLPGHTLTAVIAPAGQGDVSEEKQLPNNEGDLQNPNDFIQFLISANIRLVRAEFLVELDDTGTPMPRRQEAEAMRTRSGATALVELGEYKELHVNQTSGHVTIRSAEGPATVRFRAVSHMWEAMQHPDPWGFQVRSIAKRYREFPRDSVTWVFVDFMSLHQYKRSAAEDEFFRKALNRMHWLYSHEIVHVDILTELTPEDKKFEGEILVYNATEDQVTLTPICELQMNSTPYELRGWCQSESEWSRLRMDVHGGAIPTPPEIFRRRMQRMRFTHRNDAEQVFALQEKVFRDKVSRTTHLQLQELSADDLECLYQALPHYSHLEYIVVNGNALKGQDAVAILTSGAVDIQMESCTLEDEDADAMAEALMSGGADRLEHLSLTGNCFGDAGTAALRKVMEQRPQLKIRW